MFDGERALFLRILVMKESISAVLEPIAPALDCVSENVTMERMNLRSKDPDVGVPVSTSSRNEHILRVLWDDTRVCLLET